MKNSETNSLSNTKNSKAGISDLKKAPIKQVIHDFRMEFKLIENYNLLYSIFYQEFYRILEFKGLKSVGQIKEKHLILMLLSLYKKYNEKYLQGFKSVWYNTFYYLQSKGYFTKEYNPYSIIERVFQPDLFDDESGYDN